MMGADLAKWILGEAEHAERIAARYKAGSKFREIYLGRAGKFRDAAVALSAAQPVPGVTVKPIVWVRRPIAGGEERVMSYDGYYWLSRVPDGFLVIGEDGRGHVQRLSGEVHATEEDAKAAAQAHFEDRIRSALIPTPQPVERREPVATPPDQTSGSGA
jgi:hypothetical protein